ncbi:hypothetical protein ACOME3_006952 [Neoechinorhynchus agilis]
MNTERRSISFGEYFAKFTRSASHRRKSSRESDTVELRTFKKAQNLSIPNETFIRCQLAQGGPSVNVKLSSFRGMEGLYKKLAECFNIPFDSILYCTANNHKPDMNNLIVGQMGLNDFLYVHLTGRAKEIEIEKVEEMMGFIVTDNGAGKSMIKKIKKNSLINRVHSEYILPGDYIQKIDQVSCEGKRHYQVTKILRDIPLNTKFVIRLIEPVKNGFVGISFSKNLRKQNKQILNDSENLQTIRIKSDGEPLVQTQTTKEMKIVDAVNALVEQFMGISDVTLAQSIRDVANQAHNPSDFVELINQSELSVFEFPIEFIFDIWGAITDLVPV